MTAKFYKIDFSPVSRYEKAIYFDNGWCVASDHKFDCCEFHYLSLDDLNPQDFDGLEFDLTTDTFFNRIEGFGIELVPIKGWSVKIPGYGSNNGWYSSNLSIIVFNEKGEAVKQFDISECQNITWE